MSKNHKKWGFFFIAFIFIILSIAFLARLFFLQFLKHNTFKNKTTSQVQKIINLQAFRGHIFDANNKKLAISKRAYSLYVAPTQVKKNDAFEKNVHILSKHLNIPKDVLIQKASSEHIFVWIKRKVSYKVYESCLRFLPKGFYFIQEEKRYYPEKTLLADVLGFVGTDSGLSGLEYHFDQTLKGSQAQIIVEGDAKGQAFITSKRNIKGKPKTLGINLNQSPSLLFNGQNIHLTIHSTLQFLVEKYLQENINLHQAQAGHALVLEVSSGDILALADYPTFDPNTFYNYDQETLKNASLVDIFEPGSILKPIIYSIGLEHNFFTKDTLWDVPETIQIGKHTIKESHKRREGAPEHYRSEEIISKSMNVGTTLMAQKIGAPLIYRYLKKFGFGQISQYDIPGESPGILRNPTVWKDIDLATISFGQGIGVNLAQMAAAFATIANQGNLVRPNIIKKVSNENKTLVSKPEKRYQHQAIISKEVAKTVLDSLEKTVSQGSGIRAYIPGFRIGGKTGTAQMPNLKTGGYEKGAYTASFIAVLPIENPKYVIAVCIKRPQGEFLASRVAAPLAKSIAYALIDTYNLKPQSIPFSLTKRSPLLLY